MELGWQLAFACGASSCASLGEHHSSRRNFLSSLGVIGANLRHLVGSWSRLLADGWSGSFSVQESALSRASLRACSLRFMR